MIRTSLAKVPGTLQTFVATLCTVQKVPCSLHAVLIHFYIAASWNRSCLHEIEEVNNKFQRDGICQKNGFYYSIVIIILDSEN